MKPIGQQIRIARESLGWTQRRLAIAADMTESSISHCERGTYRTSIAVLERIAEAFPGGSIVLSGGEKRLVMPKTTKVSRDPRIGKVLP